MAYAPNSSFKPAIDDWVAISLWTCTQVFDRPARGIWDWRARVGLVWNTANNWRSSPKLMSIAIKHCLTPPARRLWQGYFQGSAGNPLDLNRHLEGLAEDLPTNLLGPSPDTVAFCADRVGNNWAICGTNDSIYIVAPDGEGGFREIVVCDKRLEGKHVTPRHFNPALDGRLYVEHREKS